MSSNFDQMSSETGKMILLLVWMTYGFVVDGSSVMPLKPSNSLPGIVDVNPVSPLKSSNSLHGIVDSSTSFSMPVQYSMAAPAVFSAQQAAASLTSVSPLYKTIITTQRSIPQSPSGWTPKNSQPIHDSYTNQVPMSRQQNRRISFAVGHSVSQPHFQSYNDYEPQYQHHSPPYHQQYPTYQQYQSTKIQSQPPSYHSYMSHTPPSPPAPPSFQQYHQPYVHSKPNFLSQISPYNPHAHDLLDFPMPSHKSGVGGSSTSFYNILFPLALLGISIPAIGLMYTYLSRRRRRDLNSEFDNYFRPSVDDLEYYLNILQLGIRQFQENVDN